MQRYVEIGILCDLAPPTVSECKTNVVTNPMQSGCDRPHSLYYKTVYNQND